MKKPESVPARARRLRIRLIQEANRKLSAIKEADVHDDALRPLRTAKRGMKKIVGTLGSASFVGSVDYGASAVRDIAMELSSMMRYFPILSLRYASLSRIKDKLARVEAICRFEEEGYVGDQALEKATPRKLNGLRDRLTRINQELVQAQAKLNECGRERDFLNYQISRVKELHQLLGLPVMTPAPSSAKRHAKKKSKRVAA